jgi:hypothetical protein
MSSTRQRTTIVVVIVALAASVAMGAFVGQLGSDGGDDDEAITSPRPIIATPVASPGVMPPFFGMEGDRDESGVILMNAS